jgi:hypothetical protein
MDMVSALIEKEYIKERESIGGAGRTTLQTSSSQRAY